MRLAWDVQEAAYNSREGQTRHQMCSIGWQNHNPDFLGRIELS